MTVRAIVLLIFLAIATWLDIKTRKIPNCLTVTLTMLGFGIAVVGGWGAVKESGLGLIVGLGIGVLIWLMGGFQAGDAKLIAAIGATIGIHGMLNVLAWAFVVTIPIGIAFLLIKGELCISARKVGFFLRSIALRAKMSPIKSEMKYPFAVSLLLGGILTLLFPI